MSKINDYIKEEYAPHLTFNTLLNLVESEMATLQTLMEQDVHAPTELAISAIPEVPISEIAWGKLRTAEGDTVDPAQRTQLDNFLKNIEGEDLQEKIKSINDFYRVGGVDQDSLVGDSSAATVARVLAYLTFFKTLTTIITNFNASSAGFSFEAFLGVLLGGAQVPTGHGTIADLTAADGTPISLKLYREASTKVDGSFTDLVNDLVRLGYMQYVVVMKSLSEGQPGNPLTLGGDLKFYRFNLTMDNVVTIFSQTHRNSIIELPLSFMAAPDTDLSEQLPSAADITPEQLEQKFAEMVTAAFPAMAPQILQSVDWANRDDLYVGQRIPGRSAFRKGRSRKTPMLDSPVYQTLQPLVRERGANPDGLITPEQQLEIATQLYNFNERIVDWRQGLSAERDAAIKDFKWASAEESAEFYNRLTPEQKRRALRTTRGYLYTDQFHLNRGQVANITQLVGANTQNLFPPNQTESYIGTIEVGTQAIINAIDTARHLINDSIFDIFNNLKVLTTNIQAYFAEGLQDDKKADAAESAARNIEGKTQEVRTK